jgi:integrase
MSALARSAQDYLGMRRSVGYALRQEGRLLADFVGYCERRGITRVTTEAALGWATEPSSAGPNWWTKRLAVVRGFAAHLQTVEADTEVPPKGLLPSRASRTTPYLFSPTEITALMAAARALAHPLRAASFEALIGLMAITGLRTGETMALDRADVDLEAGMLTIWRSKLGKSRLLPLHETTTAALAAYAARRDELCPRPATASFLLSGGGTRLNHTNTSTTFVGLLDGAGIVTQPGCRRPRLYDLRHGFAVATLVAWHAEGADVQARLPALSTWMGHIKPSTTYWYLQAAPELLAVTAPALGALPRRPAVTALAPILQAYFTQRLAQRQASPHTVASYRDTFSLLLRFAQQRLGKPPATLEVTDVDAALVGAFLDHPRNRARQLRRDPQQPPRRGPLAVLLRGAAMPRTRRNHRPGPGDPGQTHRHTIVSFLTADEVQALLASPDRATRPGRRDHVLLLVAVQTGLRVSELTGLTCGDVTLRAGANLRCRGKGRKERATPLTRPTARVIRDWLTERHGEPTDPLFPNRAGGRLSPDAVADLLAKHLTTAADRCPSLKAKRVSPHTLRHTAAMTLLRAGVDTSTIALWLGHAGTKVTQVYLHADLALKEIALARTAPPTIGRTRYQPPDQLLAFLENL